jgi:hypothetical protein
MPIENEGSESLSLRDQLTAAAELHREPAEETAPIAPAAPAPAAIERTRDESGKFAKPAETPPAKPVAAAPIDPAAIPAAAPARPAKPSSWKKEFDEHWNTLDPKVAEYIHQREREYSTGVSTYKTEAERARNIQTALEPFMPTMQRYNVQPDAWIQNVGRTHETLLLGSPQQKVQTLLGLAQAYGVDISQLTGQPAQPGQQPAADPNSWAAGQIAELRGQLNQFTTERQREQQAREQQQQSVIQNEIATMAADATTYPHFETVRETMAGILQSGLAQDLKSAYDKALRMHDDLWQSQQETQRVAAEAEQKRSAAAAAATARSKTVSIKSATPSGVAVNGQAKGRREAIADAVSSIGGSRV